MRQLRYTNDEMDNSHAAGQRLVNDHIGFLKPLSNKQLPEAVFLKLPLT